MRHPVCLLLLLACLVSPVSAEEPAPTRLRIATFNVAMGLDEPGELAAALRGGSDARLQQVAEILQRVRPDIVLLNEFDYDPGVDAAALLNDKYLAHGQTGHEPIRYPHHFRSAVNTGVASGLDLDGDGQVGGPGDAWGFGHFPGQYGMLLLSRLPLRPERARTFTTLPWSGLPEARRPLLPDGRPFHGDTSWRQMRLSSKSHWDIPVDIGGTDLHLLAHHPTPPVFDGPEDRNGRRNFDEIRFWRFYTDPAGAEFIQDDQGRHGGIAADAAFVLLGDFNADPADGDSLPGAMTQVLDAAWIDAHCEPHSAGAVEATARQGGINAQHSGDPALDTADFNDRYTGNLRLDYVLPSAGLRILGCGVFWPAASADGHHLATMSDHRLVWLDIAR
jgi:endonuclease/exonuclease/phosphatase family metal-dependent hydrolase